MRRILVVKLADIGDVLTATPALRSLRRTFPHAHIEALVSPHCAGLMSATGLVDEVLTFDKWRLSLPATLAIHLRRARFDAMLLLHHLTTRAGVAKYVALSLAASAPVRAGVDNGRGWFLTHRAVDLGFGARHEVEYCNDVTGLAGAAPDWGRLEFPLTEADRDFAQAALPVGRPRVVVHAGSGGYSLARRWPVQYFAETARRLAAEGASIVLVGGPDEVTLSRAVAGAAGPGTVDLTGRTTLFQLGAVLEASDAFLGNDSGVMHIAAAVGVPVVAVFGPSNNRAWGPWDPSGRSEVLRAELPCAPCFYRGHDLGTPEGCPNRTCLDLVSVDQVVEAVRRRLTVGARHASPLPQRAAP